MALPAGISFVKPGQEPVCTTGDIAGPLAQGRDVETQDVEPVVEIAPESSPSYFLFEMAICRGDDPYIQFFLFFTADTADAQCLYGTQQFGLEFDRHFPDFVEKQGAMVGQLEFSRISLPESSGKGAFS